MTAIQPCSILLLVGADWHVETVSANVAMLGDLKPAAAVRQPLADLIGSKAIHSLRNRISWLSNDESEVQDFGVEWGGVTLDLRATSDEGAYLIEAELAVEPRLPDGIGMVRAMSDRLTGDRPLKLANQAMRQLASLTGFEQVILCGLGGAVLAACQEPAADIFGETSGCTRLVADRDAEPVPLIGDIDNDLLRRAAYLAPDERHREQLAAQGIASTMTLPLRIDGKLVGSVRALHSSPHRCSAERRSVAHLFAERLVARMARLGWQA